MYEISPIINCNRTNCHYGLEFIAMESNSRLILIYSIGGIDIIPRWEVYVT